MEAGSRMSDKAVQAKTGKTWAQWFSTLDAAGARKMSHKEIVAHLSSKHKVGPWWRQMVTVGYEQARGMRALHQKPGGYEISVSKTIPVSVSALYRAWQDEGIRRRWLTEKSLAIRRSTANKSMRVTWSDLQTRVDVNFYPRGSTKSQVVVQHGKLKDSKAADGMKVYWSKTLDRLKEVLEA